MIGQIGANFQMQLKCVKFAQLSCSLKNIFHIAHYGAKQCEISHSHQHEEEGESLLVPSSYTAVSSMARVGLVHAWVQLGHDGLPQEAGCPLQVREVYDSWRTQEHGCYKEELEIVDKEIQESDMILVFGHSPALTGDTADQVGG